MGARMSAQPAPCKFSICRKNHARTNLPTAGDGRRLRPMRRGDPSTSDPYSFPQPFGSKYVLLDHLATGGMADVFVARQSGAAGFVKECVIKRILPHLARDQNFVSMFLDEARLAARLNHPNIAQVYDLGREGDAYFIAMEYVHGIDLEHVLQGAIDRGERHLPFRIAARIVAGVAEGLEHAHNADDEHGQPMQMVHRDVSPSNVVVSFDGVPKLVDFGIAKATARQSHTEVGVIKGKARYMSPEQVQGQPLDGRSDLFSLGSLLFELTTGHNPWTADNTAMVGIRIVNEEPTPPSLLVLDYPDELEAIVRAVLTKRRDERTATARSLQFHLEQFMRGSGHHATGPDVAQYLAERFPRERARRPGISGDPTAEAPKTQAEDTAHDAPPHEPSEVTSMSERKARTTGPLSLGDSAPILGDLPGDAEQQPSRRSRTGPWLFVVIVGLVVATAAGLLILRSHQISKEKEAAIAVPPAKGEEEAPSVAPSAAPAAAPEAPKVEAPPAPAGNPLAAPAAMAPDVPKVTPLAAPTVDPRGEPRRPARPKHRDAPPAALPHLPKAPPPTE
ncbi:MAG: serine/threonine protein kinase [Myxococcales bacterium]|nr:serine/threonine protein kinase [Myxococcales bacterium]